MRTGLNMTSVKQQNRSSLMHYIHLNGPVSRLDIARNTGLTPAAVTLITAPLIQSGVIVESGKQIQETVGRKKVLLSINPEYQTLMAVAINRKMTTLAVCNLDGSCLYRKGIKTTHQKAPEIFLRQIGNEIVTLKKSYPIHGISVSVTGIVDEENGVSIHAYGIWNASVNVSKILSDITGLPVILVNNVKAFTQAQLLYGKDTTGENVLMVKWGPGVGSSLVIHGQIQMRHGNLSEVGHFLTDQGEKLEDVICDSNQMDHAIEILAKTIVNCDALLMLDQIIVYGDYLENDEISQKLIDGVHHFNPDLNIVRSSLYQKESIIGCCGEYLEKCILNKQG